MPLRAVTSSTGLHSKRYPGIRFLSRTDWEIGVFQNLTPSTRLCFEFLHETGVILRCDGKVGIPFETKQGIDPPVEIRRGEGAQRKWCQEPRCSF